MVVTDIFRIFVMDGRDIRLQCITIRSPLPVLDFKIMKYIRGCRIRPVQDGYAVRNTVFTHDYNAQLYAYYLRIVFLNGGRLRYIKDFDDAVAEIFRIENRTDPTGMQRRWLRCAWERNEGRYLHVSSGMYAVSNLGQ